MPPEYFYPLLGAAFALSWGVLGVIRGALGLSRHGRRGRLRDGAPATDDGRVAALEARVGELEERIDFAERLLTKGREEGREG